jgi:hypothetical protein
MRMTCSRDHMLNGFGAIGGNIGRSTFAFA